MINVTVPRTPKRRKSNISIDEPILKSDNDDIESRSSIDQKGDEEILESSACKKVKLGNEDIVHEEDDSSISKSTVQVKIINGLKQEASNCLAMLNVTKQENSVREVIDVEEEDVSLLDNVQVIQVDSDDSEVFDNTTAVTSISQDHNYQASQ